MKKVWNALARIVLGLPLFVFGLNGFLRVIPVPKMTPEGEAFLRALVETGYMLPFWKGTEVICGIAILLGLWLPLALVVITPVILNIIAFHLWLDPNPGTMGLVALMSAALVYLAAKNWNVYRPILARRSAR
jgi:uncharacterized membrane protein YphA (DoxX/SURF4 family)